MILTIMFLEKTCRLSSMCASTVSALTPGPAVPSGRHSAVTVNVPVTANVPAARAVLPSRWNLSCLGKVPEGSPSTPLGSEDVLPIWFHWEGSHLAPGPVATWGIWTFPRAELCSVRIKDSLEGWGSQKNRVEMNKCSLRTYGLPGA